MGLLCTPDRYTAIAHAPQTVAPALRAKNGRQKPCRHQSDLPCRERLVTALGG